MSVKRLFMASTPAALGLALAAPGALAQSSGSATELEPIVITGSGLGAVDGYAAEAAQTGTRGLPADLATTPRSVSVITETQMRDQAVQTLEHVLNYTPGVFPESYGTDSRYDQFSIRGFQSQNSATYRDGMPLRNFVFASWRTEPFGMERIEVLRGPTSDLYGANEPGGLVNSVSKRPEFAFGGLVEATAFSQGGGELSFDVTGPVNDRLAYRFVSVLNDSGTDFEEVDQSRIYIAPSITWKATERTNVTLYGQYQDDEAGDGYVLVPQYGSQLSNPIAEYGGDFYTGDEDRARIESQQNYIGYAFDHEFSDGLTFRSRARHATNEWRNETTYAGAFYSSTFEDRAIDAMAEIEFDVDETADQTSFDNGLEYRFSAGDMRGTVLGGIDYYRLKGDSTRISTLVGARNLLTDEQEPFPVGFLPLPLGFGQEESYEVTQIGAYLVGNLEIGDAWQVTGSLRRDRVTSDRTLVTIAPPLVPLPADVDQSQTDWFTSASLGASYSFGAGITVYGNAARSFNLAPQGFDINGEPLDLEQSRSYEIGARFRPQGTASLFTLALFDITKTNTTQAVPGGLGAVEQVGEVRSRGAELGLTYVMENGISLLGAYTYLDTEVTKNEVNEGNQLALAPDHTASLWVDYAFQQPRLEGLRIGAGARYIGERYSDAANTEQFKVDDLLTFDASVSYAWDDWELLLAARNLTDKREVTYCYPGQTEVLGIFSFNPNIDISQAGGCTFNSGRQASISLTRRF